MVRHGDGDELKRVEGYVVLAEKDDDLRGRCSSELFCLWRSCLFSSIAAG